MEALLDINWWVVIVAMVVSMGIGSLWYSQMAFGPLWQHELKLKAKDMGGKDPTGAMVGASILTLLQAVVLALLIGNGEIHEGMRMAALVSIGVVAPALAVQYTFEGRSLRLFLVNAGYIIISALAMGALIGAWH